MFFLPMVKPPGSVGCISSMKHVTGSPDGSVVSMVNGRPVIAPLNASIVAPLPAGRLLK